MRFVFPHAPVRPVTINGGYRMRAWYDILGADLRGAARRNRPARIGRAIAALIDRERARGIAAHRIVLAGFSQGLRDDAADRPALPRERLAGLAGMSGYLPLADSTAAERSEANRDVPIFLAHGSGGRDRRAGARPRSRDALAALGHAVEWHTESTRWSTRCVPEEIGALNQWLLRVLGAAP